MAVHYNYNFYTDRYEICYHYPMNSFIVSLFLLVLLMNRCNATIVTTASLEPIIQACKKNLDNTLVIFDIDEVLMIAADKALQGMQRRDVLHKEFYRATTTSSTIDFACAYSGSTCRLQLVDPALKELLHFLKAHAIPTIGLTAGWSGPLGDQAAFHEIRVQRLAQLGIEFDWSFQAMPLTYHFEHILAVDRHPLWHSGIIFTCNKWKSKVLHEFLKATHYWPAHIIFIDDHEANVVDMQKFCTKNSLEFKGFIYQGAQSLIEPLDCDIATLQLKHLIKHKVWLTDLEAQKLLSN